MVTWQNKLFWCSLSLAALTTVGDGFASSNNEFLDWPSAGQNEHNTRFQCSEWRIGSDNVSTLVEAWEVDTSGDVSATPAVDGKAIYFPDAGGSLWALNRVTGTVLWHKTMVDYGLPEGDYARVTPVIAGHTLIFGDQGGRVNAGATVMAVSKRTGALLWQTQVDEHPAAMVTQSAIWDDWRHIVYVGVSSQEELLAATVPGYTCCSFRGSILALDANTGRILWKTYMSPEGYSGVAVWGSTPVLDRWRNSLYIGTGNNYSVPVSVADCVSTATNPSDREKCVAPNDYFDSVVALDLKTGNIRWSRRALPYDAWVASCLPGLSDNDNCPDPAGPDYDFGQGPALFTARLPNKQFRQLLGAGQKSGQYWALDPDDGSVVWVTETGPGGAAGGLQWGSATDGRTIFTANANSEHKSWNLIQQGVETTVSTSGGLWSALDAATGRILWQVANPYPDPVATTAGVTAGAAGPVTLANGVVYGCSLDVEGHMLALDAATGSILWEFSSADSGSCAAGPAVVDGTVYWGSGYAGPFGVAGHKLRAFRLP